MGTRWDAVVVGAGPNGLAAAVELATAGRSTLVVEANETIGGGCRTAELTLPGFHHDVCSAVHPLAAASPVFRDLPLAAHGVEWIEPPVALAHPLDDEPAVLVERSIEDTAHGLGNDEDAYRSLMERWTQRIDDVLRVFLLDARAARHPLQLARLGLEGAGSAAGLIGRFGSQRARAVLAGMAAHSILPLDRSPTAGIALVLGSLAHATGWPMPAGGSGRIVDALASILRDAGGEIRTGVPVRSMRDVPDHRALVLTLTPRQLLDVDGLEFPSRYESGLHKHRYGPGVFKIDYALDAPVPWRDAACARAGTVHVGGPFEEIAEAEAAVWRGEHPDRPFVLVAQQSLFDPARAPAGKHTLWAYTHVPNGSTVDMTAPIERQLERFAPGFRDVVLARHTRTTADLERENENAVGGDINGGVLDLRQLLSRPAARVSPATTPLSGVYVASTAIPPGGGVHGIPGRLGARAALRFLA